MSRMVLKGALATVSPRRTGARQYVDGVARRRGRFWFVVAGAVLVLAVGGFLLARRWFLHDTTTAVASDDVLARYRASSTVAGATIAALPPAGVYRYTTTGSEHVDALGGTTH